MRLERRPRRMPDPSPEVARVIELLLSCRREEAATAEPKAAEPDKGPAAAPADTAASSTPAASSSSKPAEKEPSIDQAALLAALCSVQHIAKTKDDLFQWEAVLNIIDSVLEKAVKSARTDSSSDPLRPNKMQLLNLGKDTQLVSEALRVSALIIESCSSKNLQHYSSCEHVCALTECTDANVLLGALRVLAALGRYRQRLPDAEEPALLERLVCFTETFSAQGELTSAFRETPRESLLSPRFEFRFFRSGQEAAELSRPDHPVASEEVVFSVQDGDKPKGTHPTLWHSLVAEHAVPNRVQYQLFVRLQLFEARRSPPALQLFGIAKLMAIQAWVLSHPSSRKVSAMFESQGHLVAELIQAALSTSDSKPAVPKPIRVGCIKTLQAFAQAHVKLNHMVSQLGARASHGHLFTYLRSAVSNPQELDVSVALLTLLQITASHPNGFATLAAPVFVQELLKVLEQLNESTVMATRALRVLEVVCLQDPTRVFSSPQQSKKVTALLEGRIKREVELSLQRSAQQQVTDKAVASSVLSGLLRQVDKDHSTDALVAAAAVTAEATTKENTTVCDSEHKSLLKVLMRIMLVVVREPSVLAETRDIVEGTFPSVLEHIVRAPKFFGNTIWNLATKWVAEFCNSEPNLLPTLQESGLTRAILDVISVEIPASADALVDTPSVLAALSLNEQGLQQVQKSKAVKALFRVFCNSKYLSSMYADIPSMYGAAVDELFRHQPSLRDLGIAALVGVLEKLVTLANHPSVECIAGSDHNLRRLEKQLTQRIEKAKTEDAGTVGSVVTAEEDEEAKKRLTTVAESTATTGERHRVALLDMITKTMRFVDTLINNSHHREYANSLREHKALSIMLRLVRGSQLPTNFMRSTAHRAITSTYCTLCADMVTGATLDIMRSCQEFFLSPEVDQLVRDLETRDIVLDERAIKVVSVAGSLTDILSSVIRSCCSRADQGLDNFLDDEATKRTPQLLTNAASALMWQLNGFEDTFDRLPCVRYTVVGQTNHDVLLDAHMAMFAALKSLTRGVASMPQLGVDVLHAMTKALSGTLLSAHQRSDKLWLEEAKRKPALGFLTLTVKEWTELLMSLPQGVLPRVLQSIRQQGGIQICLDLFKWLISLTKDCLDALNLSARGTIEVKTHKHKLKRMDSNIAHAGGGGPWVCNTCERTLYERVVHRCAECDFDLCISCLELDTYTHLQSRLVMGIETCVFFFGILARPNQFESSAAMLLEDAAVTQKEVGVLQFEMAGLLLNPDLIARLPVLTTDAITELLANLIRSGISALPPITKPKPAPPAVDEHLVQQLLDMGFEPKVARTALRLADGSVEQAAELMLSQSIPMDVDDDDDSAGAGASTSAAARSSAAAAAGTHDDDELAQALAMSMEGVEAPTVEPTTAKAAAEAQAKFSSRALHELALQCAAANPESVFGFSDVLQQWDALQQLKAAHEASEAEAAAVGSSVTASLALSPRDESVVDLFTPLLSKGFAALEACKSVEELHSMPHFPVSIRLLLLIFPSTCVACYRAVAPVVPSVLRAVQNALRLLSDHGLDNLGHPDSTCTVPEWMAATLMLLNMYERAALLRQARVYVSGDSKFRWERSGPPTLYLDSGWEQFSNEASDQLEKAFLQGNQEIYVVLDAKRYGVRFSNMNAICIDTPVTTKLRRVCAESSAADLAPDVEFPGLTQEQTQALSQCCNLLLRVRLDQVSMEATLGVACTLSRHNSVALDLAKGMAVESLLRIRQGACFAGFTKLFLILLRHVVEDDAVLEGMCKHQLHALADSPRRLSAVAQTLAPLVCRRPQVLRVEANKALCISGRKSTFANTSVKLRPKLPELEEQALPSDVKPLLGSLVAATLERCQPKPQHAKCAFTQLQNKERETFFVAEAKDKDKKAKCEITDELITDANLTFVFSAQKLLDLLRELSDLYPFVARYLVEEPAKGQHSFCSVLLHEILPGSCVVSGACKTLKDAEDRQVAKSISSLLSTLVLQTSGTVQHLVLTELHQALSRACQARQLEQVRALVFVVSRLAASKHSTEKLLKVLIEIKFPDLVAECLQAFDFYGDDGSKDMKLLLDCLTHFAHCTITFGTFREQDPDTSAGLDPDVRRQLAEMYEIAQRTDVGGGAEHDDDDDDDDDDGSSLGEDFDVASVDEEMEDDEGGLHEDDGHDGPQMLEGEPDDMMDDRPEDDGFLVHEDDGFPVYQAPDGDALPIGEGMGMGMGMAEDEEDDDAVSEDDEGSEHGDMGMEVQVAMPGAGAEGAVIEDEDEAAEDELEDDEDDEEDDGEDVEDEDEDYEMLDDEDFEDAVHVGGQLDHWGVQGHAALPGEGEAQRHQNLLHTHWPQRRNRGGDRHNHMGPTSEEPPPVLTRAHVHPHEAIPVDGGAYALTDESPLLQEFQQLMAIAEREMATRGQPRASWGQHVQQFFESQRRSNVAMSRFREELLVLFGEVNGNLLSSCLFEQMLPNLPSEEDFQSESKDKSATEGKGAAGEAGKTKATTEAGQVDAAAAASASATADAEQPVPTEGQAADGSTTVGGAATEPASADGGASGAAPQAEDVAMEDASASARPSEVDLADVSAIASDDQPQESTPARQPSTSAAPAAGGTHVTGASDTAAASAAEGDADDSAALYQQEFLAALPEELRREVMEQELQSGAAAASPLAQASPEVLSNVNPEFIAALPPDLQREVLQQAQQELRQRQQAEQAAASPAAAAAAAEEPDMATIIATFPPDVRRDVLLQHADDEAFLAALPPQVAQEAREIHATFRRQQQTTFHDLGQQLREQTLANQPVLRPRVLQDGCSVLKSGSLATMLQLMFVDSCSSLDLRLTPILREISNHNASREFLLETCLAILAFPDRDPSSSSAAPFPVRLFFRPTKNGQRLVPIAGHQVITRVCRLASDLLRRNNRALAYFWDTTEDALHRQQQQRHQQQQQEGSKQDKPETQPKVVDVLRPDGFWASTLAQMQGHLSDRKPSLDAGDMDVTPVPPFMFLLRLLTHEYLAKHHYDDVVHLLSLLCNHRNLAAAKAAVCNIMDTVDGARDAVAQRGGQGSEQVESGDGGSGEGVTPMETDDGSAAAGGSTAAQPVTAAAASAETDAGATAGASASAAAGASATAGTDAGVSTGGSTERSDKIRALGKTRSMWDGPDVPPVPELLPEQARSLVDSLLHSKRNQATTDGPDDLEEVLLCFCSVPGNLQLVCSQFNTTLGAWIHQLTEALKRVLTVCKGLSASAIRKRFRGKAEEGGVDRDPKLQLALLRSLRLLQLCEKAEEPQQLRLSPALGGVGHPPEGGDGGDKPEGGDALIEVDVQPLWAQLRNVLVLARDNDLFEESSSYFIPLLEVYLLCHNDCQPRRGNEPAPAAGSREATFLAFVEEFKDVLNQLVKKNPARLFGSFALLVRFPNLLEFAVKESYFRHKLKRSRPRRGHLRLKIRREHVFEDSYMQLQRYDAEALRGKVNVQFHGEAGVDAGGLTRAWYFKLSQAMMNPHYALFKQSHIGSETYMPNQHSSINVDHLQYFAFCGKIVAKAIYDGQLLDCHFTRAFYKQMLGVPVSWRDMQAVDQELYKNFVWILENDVDDMEMVFAVDDDRFGDVKTVELKTDGQNIKVTNQNKKEYVRLVADMKLTQAIKSQLEAFQRGFYSLVPQEEIAIFNEQELEMIISGLPTIDIDDFRANTEYVGYNAGSAVIQWFWRAVRSFTNEERVKLVQFTTGTGKIPVGGFAALVGMSGPQKFNIHKDHHTESLPQAHTCFNQLVLPQYESYDQLRKMLLLAITEGAEGFGFA